MNIPSVVRGFLEEELFQRQQLSERLWLTTCNREQEFVSLLVAPAPGGAYSCFGKLKIEESTVTLSLKTVWGIMAHRHELRNYRFDFCDPAFPDNVLVFVKQAAANAQRCFDLSHQRCWARFGREVRKI